jgi:hypothetical protein
MCIEEVNEGKKEREKVKKSCVLKAFLPPYLSVLLF